MSEDKNIHRSTSRVLDILELVALPNITLQISVI